MFEKIIGVITLKAPVYKSIAEDQTLTSQAAIIVVIATLIQGFSQGFVKVGADGTMSPSVVGGIVGAIVTVILGLIAWVVAAWVLAFVAKALGGKTDTGEMLRVTGFVQVFSVVGILNLAALVSTALLCITGIIGLVVAVLSLIGYFIGVREAAEFGTGKAIVTALIAAVVNFIIVGMVGGAIMAAVLAAGMIAS